MVNPVSNSQPAPVERAVPLAPPPPPEPPIRVQKTGELSSDTVTLKHAGDVEYDGDSQ